MKLLLPLSALCGGAIATDGYDVPMGDGRDMAKNEEAQQQAQQGSNYNKKMGKNIMGNKDMGKDAGAQRSQQQDGELRKEDRMKVEIDIKININVRIIEQRWDGSAHPTKYNKLQNPGQSHLVNVGGPAGLIYSPETINAEINDVIIFNFMGKDHTVTQSTFDKPCVRNTMGVDSGFMPTYGKKGPVPYYKFQVLTKEPTWFLLQTEDRFPLWQGYGPFYQY